MNDRPTCRARSRFIAKAAIAFAYLALGAIPAIPTYAQDAKHLERERERGVQMLKATKDLIKSDYYDLRFHGVDLDARFKVAEAKLKTGESLGHIFGIIAQVVAELDDSHTFFIPPTRPVEIEYGWRMQVIGDDPYVIAVKPGSDAAAQGLKPGDKIISVDGFTPSRQTMWKMNYSYNVLRPQAGISVVVQSPGQEPRKLNLKADVIRTGRAINLTELRNRILADEENEKNIPVGLSIGDDVMIWKLRAFDLTEGKVDEMMKKVRTHKALVLDLRGNPGGYVKTLNRLVSYFFDKEIKIADVKTRKKTEEEKSKPRRGKTFSGKLFVLVDSESGSAAEMFAKVVELEKRGTVIGDITAGAVMQSSFEVGILTDESSSNVVLFGVSITNADVIMTDGKSLENIGVTPNEMLLPSPKALADNVDPVLSYAVTQAGATLSPEGAGKLFPFVWPVYGK
jgi:carboxyl-terminal processing protease